MWALKVIEHHSYFFALFYYRKSGKFFLKLQKLEKIPMKSLQKPFCQRVLVRLSSCNFHSIYCNVDRSIEQQVYPLATCHWRKNRNFILKFWGNKWKDFFGIAFVRGIWLDCVQPEPILKVVSCSYLWSSVWLICYHFQQEKLTTYWKPKKNEFACFRFPHALFVISHVPFI